MAEKVILSPVLPGGWQPVPPTPTQGEVQMSTAQPHPRLVEAELHNESDEAAVLRVYKSLMDLPTEAERREYLSKFSVPMQQAVNALAKKARQRGESVTLSNPVTRVGNPTSDPRFGSTSHRELSPSQKENIEVAKEWNKSNPDDRVAETSEGGLSLRSMGWGGSIPAAGEIPDSHFVERADQHHARNAKLFGWDEPLSAEEHQIADDFRSNFGNR